VLFSSLIGFMLYYLLSMSDFNWTSFFIGLVIIGVGAAMVGFYRQLANSFMGGAANYEKIKLWGLAVCALGFIVMFNIHTAALNLIFGPLMGR